ncbi:pyridoxamine 5'-phosphate oxidase family protein [Tsukamurella soli]|uniref:Pyridoxamine 5'-phosphate oxidase family protein n=1 Tax=Tsukamurella soli TaxID=644556 RepID=A0ABP8JNN5_9ACTN
MSTYTLPGDQAWDKLRHASLGRIVTTAPDGTIEVFPVTYAIYAGEILIRTRLGTKFRNLARHPDTVFEVDGCDDDTHTAWSVVVHADARLEPTAAVRRHADAAHPGPVVDIEAAELVVLAPYRLSARRYHLR